MMWWMGWWTLLACPKASPDGTSLVEQLEREVIAGRERVKMLEAELSVCGEPVVPVSLYPELIQVFQGSDVEITQKGNATRLVVKTSHLFGDPYALKSRAEGDPTLDLLSVALRRYSDHQVLIIGHTSDRPLPQKWATAYTSLTDWSAAIAGELVRRLVEEFGCDATQFTVGGRGAYSPRESNDLETGRDANQRLEIWIYPPSSTPSPVP